MLEREDSREEGRIEGCEEGREEGNLEKLIMLICKKLKKEKSVEEIADDLEEEVSAIEPLCQMAEQFAPEYDWKEVMEKVISQYPRVSPTSTT